MQNLFSIEGKVAIVTGGSRGIGAMIAEGYARAGAKVYITSRKAEELNDCADRLGKLGFCKAIPGDLSTLEGITQFVDAFRAQESSLDILVNNAGATWGAPLDEFPETGWDKVMDINTKSVFFLTQKCLPLLRQSASKENPTRVINIASVNALRNSHMDNFSYSASKAAVITLTQHLSATLAREGINVNAIAPGYFPSKMTAFMFEDEKNREQITASVPTGRVGEMEDAAGTAIYLASRASAFMSGDTLVLDGGLVANA